MPAPARSFLAQQLAWFTMLRWIAGAAAVVAAAVDLLWGGQFPQSRMIVILGVAILVYNAVLWIVLQGLLERRCSCSPGSCCCWTSRR